MESNISRKWIYDQTLGREYVGMNDQTSRVEVRGHQKKENRKSIFSQFTLLLVASLYTRANTLVLE